MKYMPFLLAPPVMKGRFRQLYESMLLGSIFGPNLRDGFYPSLLLTSRNNNVRLLMQSGARHGLMHQFQLPCLTNRKQSALDWNACLYFTTNAGKGAATKLTFPKLIGSEIGTAAP